MSFDCSWLAYQGVRKQDVLAIAGLRDTGQIEEAPESPFSYAEFPNGWTVLFATDSTYAYKHIATLSANHAVLSVIIQEYVPLSMLASFHIRSEMIWSVFHDGNAGALDLTVSGKPPPEFALVRDRLMTKQKSQKHGQRAVDYVYHIPIELAEAVCGYWHDRFVSDRDRPAFTIAVPEAR